MSAKASGNPRSTAVPKMRSIPTPLDLTARRLALAELARSQEQSVTNEMPCREMLRPARPLTPPLPAAVRSARRPAEVDTDVDAQDAAPGSSAGRVIDHARAAMMKVGEGKRSARIWAGLKFVAAGFVIGATSVHAVALISMAHRISGLEQRIQQLTNGTAAAPSPFTADDQERERRALTFPTYDVPEAPSDESANPSNAPVAASERPQ